MRKILVCLGLVLVACGGAPVDPRSDADGYRPNRYDLWFCWYSSDTPRAIGRVERCRNTYGSEDADCADVPDAGFDVDRCFGCATSLSDAGTQVPGVSCNGVALRVEGTQCSEDDEACTPDLRGVMRCRDTGKFDVDWACAPGWTCGVGDDGHYTCLAD